MEYSDIIIKTVDLLHMHFHLIMKPFNALCNIIKKFYHKWKINRLYNQRAYRVYIGLSEEHKCFLHELMNNSTTDKFDKTIKSFRKSAEAVQAVDRAIRITTYDEDRYGRGSQLINYREECTQDAIYIKIDPELHKLIKNYKPKHVV